MIIQSQNSEIHAAQGCLKRIRSEVFELSKTWALFEAMNPDEGDGNQQQTVGYKILGLGRPLFHLRRTLFVHSVLAIFRLSDYPDKRHTFCTLSKVFSETRIDEFWKGRLDLEHNIGQLERYRKEQLALFPTAKWADHVGEQFFKNFREEYRDTRHGYLAHTDKNNEYKMPNIEEVKCAIELMVKLVKQGGFVVGGDNAPIDETIQKHFNEANELIECLNRGLRQSEKIKRK